jgi:hypothetical protein
MCSSRKGSRRYRQLVGAACPVPSLHHPSPRVPRPATSRDFNTTTHLCTEPITPQQEAGTRMQWHSFYALPGPDELLGWLLPTQVEYYQWKLQRKYERTFGYKASGDPCSAQRPPTSLQHQGQVQCSAGADTEQRTALSPATTRRCGPSHTTACPATSGAPACLALSLALTQHCRPVPHAAARPHGCTLSPHSMCMLRLWTVPGLLTCLHIAPGPGRA